MCPVWLDRNKRRPTSWEDDARELGNVLCSRVTSSLYNTSSVVRKSVPSTNHGRQFSNRNRRMLHMHGVRCLLPYAKTTAFRTGLLQCDEQRQLVGCICLALLEGFILTLFFATRIVIKCLVLHSSIYFRSFGACKPVALYSC